MAGRHKQTIAEANQPTGTSSHGGEARRSEAVEDITVTAMALIRKPTKN
jgi:hypothetical protein